MLSKIAYRSGQMARRAQVPPRAGLWCTTAVRMQSSSELMRKSEEEVARMTVA